MYMYTYIHMYLYLYLDLYLYQDLYLGRSPKKSGRFLLAGFSRTASPNFTGGFQFAKTSVPARSRTSFGPDVQ